MANLKKIYYKTLTIFAITSFFSIFNVNTSKAFIPSIYEPNAKELKEAGKSIGDTAARLIYFGQFRKAIELAELSVRLAPQDDTLWSILAEAQVRNNELDLARSSLKQANKLNPKKASYLFSEASILIRQENTKSAIKLIKQGLTIDPNSADAYFQLGNSLLIQKEFNKALTAFKKASTIKPAFWQALNNQGLVLYEQGKINLAIDTWEKVLEIKSHPEPSLALAAALYAKNRENKKCIFLAKKSLKEDPNYAFEKYQKEQLWGEKIRKATKKLFKSKNLRKSIEKALANATTKLADNK